MHELDKYVSIQEAADMIGTTPKALYRRYDKGTGPKVTKVLGRSLIHLDDLASWMNTNPKFRRK